MVGMIATGEIRCSCEFPLKVTNRTKTSLVQTIQRHSFFISTEHSNRHIGAASSAACLKHAVYVLHSSEDSAFTG